MSIKFKEYDEMSNHFHNRTKMHILLVQKYAKIIEDLYPTEFKGLAEQTKEHDKSKFQEPEYTPYLHVNWKYKLLGDGKKYDPPQEILDSMNGATYHHIKNNSHHPEYHTNQTQVLNVVNRDAPPDHIVDATKMPMIDIGEMVADWLAIAEERNTNPIEWANKNINIRWKFTDEQKNMIYDIINKVFKR